MPSTWSDSEETQTLIELTAQGDEAAAEQLFARHLPMVKTSVRRRIRTPVQSRFDDSDVLQEAHALAHRQLNDLVARRPMPFRLWLLKTAHQRLLDYERAHLRARRSVHRELPLPDQSSMALIGHLHIATTPTASAILQQREQAQLVRRCLALLSELDREILLLRVFDGLKNPEVSVLLELPPATTKKRFTRALLRLKGHLRQAGLSE